MKAGSLAFEAFLIPDSDCQLEDIMTGHGAIVLVSDGDGNRVSETIGGTVTKYLVDTLNPTGYAQVLDEQVNGAVARTYAYGLQRISEDQLVGSTWTPSFYVYDGHGNVRALANTAGAVTDTYQFDAFGNVIASTGTTANNYLYSGEQFDSAVGLYYLRARYYRPVTGRFWTADPDHGRIRDPLTLNKYIYTGNNPVNASDPSGRGIVEDVVIRAYIFTQITAPIYLRTQQGQAAVALAGFLGVIAFEARCEFLELIEALEDLSDTSPHVKAPPFNCNIQPDEGDTE